MVQKIKKQKKKYKKTLSRVASDSLLLETFNVKCTVIQAKHIKISNYHESIFKRFAQNILNLLLFFRFLCLICLVRSKIHKK